jgi:anti-sigma regulatory factor (Ser/Thr protein kinase)
VIANGAMSSSRHMRLIFLLADTGRAGVDARTAHHIALAFDELLANLGSHGNSADKLATVRVVVEPDMVKGEVIDSGPAFDIRTVPDPDLSQRIEDRQAGGLGLF